MRVAFSQSLIEHPADEEDTGREKGRRDDTSHYVSDSETRGLRVRVE